MSRLVKRIIGYILARRQKRLEKLQKKLAPQTYTTSTGKTHINATETMHLSAETDKNKEKMDSCIKNIILQNLETPEKLLEYIENDGTPVYKTPIADKILNLIKEEEGLITPMSGLKALYLNIMLGLFSKKSFNLSLKTAQMFVLRDKPVNLYYMIHQFHKWYGFKIDLPGYDAETQESFKKAFSELNENEFKEMSIGELIGLKEAIARDAEAIDFVINLARERDGAKNALDKMKNDGSANI